MSMVRSFVFQKLLRRCSVLPPLHGLRLERRARLVCGAPLSASSAILGVPRQQRNVVSGSAAATGGGSDGRGAFFHRSGFDATCFSQEREMKIMS